MRPAHLSQLLTEILRAGAAPGAAIAMSVGGERIEASAGIANSASGDPLSSQSRFQLGCITKLLTSLVALELWSSGQLDLDRPITAYLPEMTDVLAGSPLTSRHLLSHTSGYQGVNIADPGVRYYFGWPKFLEGLRAGVQLFPAGHVFSYEHTECVMLGEILQRITAQPMRELLHTHIFGPLAIECGDLRADAMDPRYCVMDHAFDTGSGRYTALRAVPYCRFWESSLSDLTISLADLVTLGSAVAGFGPRQVFSANTVDMIRRPQVALPAVLGGAQCERIPLAFGCGCAQYGDSVFGHNGSARGQTCALRFDSSAALVVAVGLNSWRPHVRDMLCAKTIAAVSGKAADSAHKAAPVEWPFAELTGRYIGARGTYVDVTADDTTLNLYVRAHAPPSTAHVALRPGRNGDLEVSSELAHLTVGFFPIPASATPALMIGLNAYRREAQG